MTDIGWPLGTSTNRHLAEACAECRCPWSLRYRSNTSVHPMLWVFRDPGFLDFPVILPNHDGTKSAPRRDPTSATSLFPCQRYAAIGAIDLHAGNAPFVQKCLPALGANTFPARTAAESAPASAAAALAHAATHTRALPGRACTISSRQTKPPVSYPFPNQSDHVIGALLGAQATGGAFFSDIRVTVSHCNGVYGTSISAYPTTQAQILIDQDCGSRRQRNRHRLMVQAAMAEFRLAFPVRQCPDLVSGFRRTIGVMRGLRTDDVCTKIHRCGYAAFVRPPPIGKSPASVSAASAPSTTSAVAATTLSTTMPTALQSAPNHFSPFL